MKRFTANSWTELAAARASLVECDFAQFDCPFNTLKLVDCETGDVTNLAAVLDSETLTVVVLLRHFA